MALKTYGYMCKLMKNTRFASAKKIIVNALKEEGFGVLTEIDAQATFEKKLGSPFRKYLILGACNPELAHQAIGVEPHAGLLMPCNVVLQEIEKGQLMVSMQKPTALLALAGNDKLKRFAAEADARIRRVLKAVEAASMKDVTLDDVKPRHPADYPGKKLRGQLDSRRSMLSEIKGHYSSEGLEAAELIEK